MSTPEDPNRRRVRKRVEPRPPGTPAVPAPPTESSAHGSFTEGTPPENLPTPSTTQPTKDNSFSAFQKSTKDEALKPTEADLRRRSREKKKEARSKKPAPAPTPHWDQNDEELAAQEAARIAEAEAKGLEKKEKSRKKRKEEPNIFEILFSKMSKVFIVFAGLVVLAVIALATWGIVMLRDKYGGEEALASSNQAPKIDPAVMTAANKSGALEAISNYLEADGWQAKLPFIRNPESLQDTLSLWYSKLENSDEAKSLGDALFFKQQIDDGKVIVLTAVQVAPENNIQFFAVEKTPDNQFLVDWEVSEAYQEMPVEVFKQLKPTEPKEFRLKIQRDSSYSGSFPESKYQAFRLTYPNMQDFSFIGYTIKDSNLAADLDALTNLGQNKPVIVTIQYPQGVSDVSRVRIASLKHENWFR